MCDLALKKSDWGFSEFEVAVCAIWRSEKVGIRRLGE